MRIVIQMSNGEIQRVFSEDPHCGVVIEEVFPVFPGDEYPRAKLNFLSSVHDPEEVQARFVEMARQKKDQEVEA